MNDSLLLWMALALVVFWSVGVYNRLMRMRARGFDAFGSVEKHLRQYVELVREYGPVLETGRMAGVRDQSDGTSMAWRLLAAALQEMEQALKESRAQPLAVAPLSHLATAMAALQTAWAALRDTPADLAGAIVPDAMQKRWELIDLSVENSRHGFNQILRMYNQALTQFPASLIVGAMGFGLGGTL